MKNTQKNAQVAEKKSVKLTEEQKAQKALEKKLKYDSENVYFPSTKKDKNGKTVTCNDPQSGTYTDNAVVINSDRYNWTIITPQADGTCYVDSYTKGKDTSASYSRNNTYAKKVRGESKQVAIMATRGLPFSEFLAICKQAKRFKPCTNAQALAWIENALKAQKARSEKTQAQKVEEAPKAEQKSEPQKAKRQPKAKAEAQKEVA